MVELKKRKFKVYACDFETTVYEGQSYTEVWASACVEVYTEDVKIFHSIEEQFDYFKRIPGNIMCYYHNLRFDGGFWLDFLIRKLEYRQAYRKYGKKDYEIEWLPEKDMPTNSFKYSITDMGRWYTLTIKLHNKVIEMRDSLKLMPFSLKEIGESFKTQHRKLTMYYEGFRYAGCPISDEEASYIRNDVLVLKEALEIMFNEGHTKMTIGTCCMEEFKKLFRLQTPYDFKEMFPNLYDYELTNNDYGNAGEWIRRSYKGGWCYLVKGKENRIYRNGITADVNSLYPSVMHGDSGNIYPVGLPIFWSGDYIPLDATRNGRFYFIRFQCRFYIKPGKLPFLQIKNSLLYKSNECLESSDIYDRKTGEHVKYLLDENGKKHYPYPEITMTCEDFKLFQEHYDLVDFKVIDGCWFYGGVGLFDDYIDKYKQIKMTSSGAKRTLAKLFLNNLYGKFASNTDSSFKLAYIKDDGNIGYHLIPEFKKNPGYIAIGSAVTSYARCFTIRAAQKNYHGVDQPGFIYADTDSIHCDISKEEIKGVVIDDVKFGCWDIEAEWDKAIFARQKTYIEHVNGKNPFHNIKCAGMPDTCKRYFELSLSAKNPRRMTDGELTEYYEKTGIDLKNLDEDALEFLYDSYGNFIKREYEDFRPGFKVPGKLMPKRIIGGILLVSTWYEMN